MRIYTNFFKLFHANYTHHEFKYKKGLNVDCNEFDSDCTHSCCAGGLYFSTENHITEFLYNDAQYISLVKIPKNTKYIKDPDNNKYRAYALNVIEFKSLSDVKTWKWMNKHKIRFDQQCISWLIQNSAIEALKYVIKKLKYNDYTELLNCAIENSVTYNTNEVIKYCVEQGAEINEVVIDALLRRNKKPIIKYLIEHGLNVNSNSISDNDIIATNDLETIKLFVDNGRKIKDNIDWIFYLACETDDIKIVKYIYSFKPNINAYMNGCFREITVTKNMQILEFLLKHNKEANLEYTLVNFAYKTHNTKMCKLLAKYGYTKKSVEKVNNV